MAVVIFVRAVTSSPIDCATRALGLASMPSFLLNNSVIARCPNSTPPRSLGEAPLPPSSRLG